MFDVDRGELLRKVKQKQMGVPIKPLNPTGNAVPAKLVNHMQGRRGRRLNDSREFDPDVQAAVPAQLDARCNYCSSSLGLKSQDTHANQWLSKMKPVLSCCPTCRKPLPRCAICMLSLGSLNPYIELTKERGRGRGTPPPPDDLSTLQSLPFAEWFTWCMRCKHGGHAHHMIGWFASHEVCPVSGCDCQCQVRFYL
jgi:hypothetical protein